MELFQGEYMNEKILQIAAAAARETAWATVSDK